MKKILAFAGSNSSTSINHALVASILESLPHEQTELIRLTSFVLPMFSEDIEKEEGYSEPLKELHAKIRSVDGLIISVNEHNGTVSAYFKNVIDWLSRNDREFLKDKKVLLFSTSYGKRGAMTALEYCKGVLPRFGAEVYNALPMPLFGENFSLEEGRIVNTEIQQRFAIAVEEFSNAI